METKIVKDIQLSKIPKTLEDIIIKQAIVNIKKHAEYVENTTNQKTVNTW